VPGPKRHTERIIAPALFYDHSISNILAVSKMPSSSRSHQRFELRYFPPVILGPPLTLNTPLLTSTVGQSRVAVRAPWGPVTYPFQDSDYQSVHPSHILHHTSDDDVTFVNVHRAEPFVPSHCKQPHSRRTICKRKMRQKSRNNDSRFWNRDFCSIFF